MLDNVTIQIPFNSSWVECSGSPLELNAPDPFSRQVVASVDPRYLPNVVGAKEVFYNSDGLQVTDVYCPWESIKSSHAGMALKVFFAGNGACKWPYLEIKCSPAKLLQGHNVYGFDDLGFSCRNMLNLLNNAYPEFLGGYEVWEDRGAMLDLEKARISGIDITYSLRIVKEKNRLAFIDFIRTLSKGHTKNTSNSYDSTVYFGSKNSRLKKIKVYLKHIEVLKDNEQRAKKRVDLIPEEVVQLSTDLVRVEATIKKEWLERRAFPSNMLQLIKCFEANPNLYRSLFSEATKEFFEAMKGQEVTIMNDDKIYAAIDKIHGDVRGKTARLFGFYQGLKTVGFESYARQYPERTFRRNIKELEMCGFSRAILCALDKELNTVVKLPNIIKLDAVYEPCPATYDYKQFAVA